MNNGIALSGSCSRRKFLLNEPVFLGFHDFRYEWGRQIALHCKQEGLGISWKERTRIPRTLGAALWGAMSSGTFIQ